jgi:ribonuclease Z
MVGSDIGESQMMRRKHGTTASSILALAAALSTSDLAGQQIKVTLLGTGGPLPSVERFGPSTLIEAGGRAFLIDAGRGALQRLAQAGVRWADVEGVLLTHLHSDHIVGLPDLWLTGWLVRPGRARPLTVWGPVGTGRMMEHLREAFAFDIQIRQSDDGASTAGAQVNALEVTDGVVYDSGGVRITAFLVDHAPVEPALGYRIDHAGRSVVVSGDTRVSENVIRHATGVDLLIHEVASGESFVRAGVPVERARSVIARHVTPEQAGRVFARTRPRLAVYSHIIHATATDEDLVPGTRREYSGRLEVGVDLMVITIGDSIDVRRPGGARN